MLSTDFDVDARRRGANTKKSFTFEAAGESSTSCLTTGWKGIEETKLSEGYQKQTKVVDQSSELGCSAKEGKV